MMLLRIIIEGLILSVLLVAACAFGIRHGPVHMVFLYHQDVQDRSVERQLITRKQIERNARLFKSIGIPFYILYVLVAVYGINKAHGFLPGFWQMFAILEIVNLTDRFLIDEYWVGHTSAWDIEGTEDLKPYIDRKDKIQKWLMGTVGFALIAALLALFMSGIL